MDGSLGLVAKFLVHQQFYCEDDDTIVSRDMHVRMNIPGAKNLVESFVNEFLDGIHLISEGEYHQYIVRRAEKLPIKIDLIEGEFNNTLDQLDEDARSDVIIANFLIGSMRAALQKREFVKCINDVKHMLEIKFGKEQIGLIQERLQYLYSTSDPTVSLLHNLALLRLLSALYGTDKMYDTIDALVEDHCITLIEKLGS